MLILEPAAGCFAIEELVSVVRRSRELEGFWAAIERPIRDDLRRESRGLLELVRFRLGLLVVDGGSSRLARPFEFELTAGCLAVVEVDGFRVVIFLPIRKRVLPRKASCGRFELVIPPRPLVMPDLSDVEFEGCLAVIRLPIRERALVVAALDELRPRDC